MNLNEQQLKEIESLSGIFLEPDEIAILLDLDEKEFLEDIRLKRGELWKAFFRGKTESKKDIHTNIVKMAKHGSPQAEEMAKQMIVQQEIAQRRVKNNR